MDTNKVSQTVTRVAVNDWLKGVLALLGISGPMLLLYAGFVSLFLAGNYDFISDSISSLTWTGMGWVQNMGFIITGFFVEAFAAVLYLNIKGTRGFGLGTILLALSGFFLLFIGLFPTDNSPLVKTVEGTIHGIAANTLFITLPLAILIIAPSLRKDPYWKSLFGYSLATAGFALVWIALYRFVFISDMTWFGLYERILAMVQIGWVEVTAIWLLPLCRRSVPATGAAPESGIPAASGQTAEYGMVLSGAVIEQNKAIEGER